MGFSGYVHVEVDIKAESDKAFLIVYNEREIWLPKSQIADSDDYSKGDTEVSIAITDWIAEQNGITS